ncbi:MAG: acyl-CoA desaturase [Gammaproteobacteria bacterium]|nr:transposase [Gammaproteobacteria bacterium]PCH62455.1 MAG: acyl-CoA desaturase [Gammaproteobacteria bacterium]
MTLNNILNFLDGGLLEPTVWGYIGWTLLLTHITIIGVTVYLHRCQAHRALQLHVSVSHFFRFWMWLTTGMRTKEWAAIHRKHHAKCETEGDPHSPVVLGINTVLWRGAELYQEEADNAETLERYGKGTPDDWIERHLYARSKNWGLSVMFVLDIMLFGVAGIAVWAVQMVWIPFFAAGVVNGLGHWWGYRSYECDDAATNILPIGILIGGEELHNNHHAFASSAKLSSKWYEFDIGWMYICLLEMFLLAKVKKLPPELTIDRAKMILDTDTVVAMVGNRLQVMSNYCQDVLKRVHRDEVGKADRVAREDLHRSLPLLIREESLMDGMSKERLESVLDASEVLTTVYSFKRNLQEIMRRSAVTHEHLLEAIQEWCRQAEATGIKALEEFAQALRGYSMQTAPAMT